MDNNLKESARNRTYFNKEYINKLTAGLIKYYSDPDKKARLSEAICKHCFYVYTSRIGGSAITHKNCDICNEVQTFASTCTDALCQKCAIENKICKHCGAKLD